MRKETAFLAMLAIAALSGCRRERLQESFVAIDNGLIVNALDETQSIVNQEAGNHGFAGLSNGSGEVFRTAADCPEVTFSAPMGTFPNTMTIDFGTGCTGYYGVERSGKIIATFTGPYPEAGTVITTTTEDYYVNGNLVEGTRTVTNMGTNDAGNIWFTVVTEGGHVHLSSGEDIYANINHEREWIEGAGGLPVWDDVYLISGTESGTNRFGIDFTATITDPLRRELDCRWPTSGTRVISTADHPDREIDFGDGECDNIATVTVDGDSFEIELPL